MALETHLLMPKIFPEQKNKKLDIRSLIDEGWAARRERVRKKQLRNNEATREWKENKGIGSK